MNNSKNINDSRVNNKAEELLDKSKELLDKIEIVQQGINDICTCKDVFIKEFKEIKSTVKKLNIKINGYE